jgi:hypothetical protein
MAALTLLTSDLISDIAPVNSVWGIYSGGVPVIVADSVADMSYRQEWVVSDYPVEQGAFQSFDKVQLPFDVHFRYLAGSAAARQALLASIAAIANTTNLYDVVTPDAVYNSVTITHYDYARAAHRGLGLLGVDVWALWVNQQAAAANASGNTASPSGANPVSNGTQQPSTPSVTQMQAVAGGIGAQ